MFLCVFGSILFIFGIICIFSYNNVMWIVYASLGAALFSIYIVIDTQQIVGGKHKRKFQIDEYISAAVRLYLDIVYLLMFAMAIAR